jgi:L,D-transpeptidase ErfK/SrfK
MKRIFALCLFLLLSSRAYPAVITGGETVYRVVEGDSLLLISAKLGANMKTIARENNLDPDERLQPGQELRINTAKIAPRVVNDGIIVDIPGRMLYYFKAGKLGMFFPVGLGMPRWNGITRWRTPAKPFTITGKERNPVWYVPESIQWQLQVQGKPVITRVPPGPDNPLGRYVLYTSIRGIAIHETIWPTTVYQFRSHGCVRVLSSDIEQFYNEIEVGTQGESVYEPVKVAVTDEGRVFLEVDPDIYGKVKSLKDEAINRINKLNAAAEVKWDKVRKIVHEQSGNAEDITLFPVPVRR